MSEHSAKNGAGLQILQTILVAMLLGVTGWLATAVIQNREESVRLRTQFEERKVTLDTMQTLLTSTVKTQQEVLQKLISLEDGRLSNERRINDLERRKSP